MTKVADKITTIICDDIRREIGNKDSLMGIYQDVIILSIPGILPRLSLMAFLRGLTKPLTHCVIRLLIPKAEPREWPFEAPTGKQNEKNARITITAGPIEIKAPGFACWEVYLNKSKKPQIIHEFEIRTIKSQI